MKASLKITILALSVIQSIFIWFENFKSENPIMIAVYEATYKLDSISNDRNSEIMILSIGKNGSLFEGLYPHKVDSIVKSSTFSQSSIDIMMTYPKTNFTYKIYKNYSEKSLLYYNKIATKEYQIKQNNIKLVWKLTNESRKVGECKCLKATANFAGRNWEAWYTTEIPVSDGPYKFSGLPGLIVEIFDTKNDYSFSLIQLKKVNYQNLMKLPTTTQVASQDEFKKANAEYMLQGVIRVANSGNSPDVAHQLIENYKKKQLRKNNLLELK